MTEYNSEAQRIYALADLLGTELIFKPGDTKTKSPPTITGEGKWVHDFGLFTCPMHSKIIASRRGDASTEPLAFINHVCGDMYMGVYFEPKTKYTAVMVLDRDKLGDKPSEFFDKNGSPAAIEALVAMLTVCKKAWAGAAVREPLAEMNITELLDQNTWVAEDDAETVVINADLPPDEMGGGSPTASELALAKLGLTSADGGEPGPE